MIGQQNLHGSMRHGSSKASSNRYPQQVASVNASSGTSIGVSQRQRALSGGGSDRVDVASHDIIGASASLPQYTLIPPQDKFLYRSRSGDHTYGMPPFNTQSDSEFNLNMCISFLVVLMA